LALILIYFACRKPHDPKKGYAKVVSLNYKVEQGKGCFQNEVPWNNTTKFTIELIPSDASSLSAASEISFACGKEATGPAAAIDIGPNVKQAVEKCLLARAPVFCGSDHLDIDENTVIKGDDANAPADAFLCSTYVTAQCSDNKKPESITIVRSNPICRAILAVETSGNVADRLQNLEDKLAVKGNVLQWKVRPLYQVVLPDPAKKQDPPDPADKSPKPDNCVVTAADLGPPRFECNFKSLDDGQATALFSIAREAIDRLNQKYQFKLDQSQSWQSGQVYESVTKHLRLTFSSAYIRLETTRDTTQDQPPKRNVTRSRTK
jgi:hypothetical protein